MPSASASGVPKPALAVTCRELAPPARMLLGSSGGPKPPGVEEEEALVELPFAVELGEAKANGERFVVGGLEARSGANFAFVASLDASGRGQTLELGRVYGDAQPPLVEVYKEGALVLVADNDASSVVLKLYAVSETLDAKSLRRGPEISGVRRDAPGFTLGMAGSSALIVHTKLDKGKGCLGLVRVGLESLAMLETARTLLPAGDAELESPKLVRRPGGYFLAWIVRTLAPPSRRPAVRNEEPDGGPSAGVLEEGPSAIELVLLDESGRDVSLPKRVTPPTARVTAFDLAAAPGGTALLVYRDDRDSPGLDRPTAEAVLVRPDGSAASKTWELGDSVGLPSLLVDASAGSQKPWAWVAVEGERAARLGVLGEEPLLLGELASDERLAGAELIAASNGRLLRTQSRGRQRELALLACGLGVPK